MFALWGINAYFTGGNAGTVVARVNGAEITKERFALAYDQARRQLQTQLGSNTPLTPKQESGLKERVLNDLILNEVLKQASLAANYRISSLQVDNYLESIPEFQDNGQFSLEKFQEVMASSMYTANDLMDLVRTTLLIVQPKLGVILTSIALPDEVNYTISLVNQERDLRYLVLTAASLANQKMPMISAEQIAAYYRDHQDEFKTPEQVSVDYVELSLKDVMNAVHPSPETLQNFYNENINNYSQPAQWKLEFILVPVASTAAKQDLVSAEMKAKALLQRVRQGENFEKLAGQFSDPALQADLQSWVTLNQLPTAFQKPVLALTKASPLSELIQADQGWVILKMVDMKETQVQPFNQVKDKVNETIVHQQAEEKMAAMRDQLADLTYEHPDSLQSAAKTLGLAIKTTTLFTLDKGGPDISSNKKIRDAAFSNDVLSLQNNSDVLQLSPETAIVLRVKSHLPQTLLPLQSVSKQIEARLQQEQTKKQLSQLADNIFQKLQSGASEDQVAQQYQLSWTAVGFIGRYSNKVASAILDRAFQLPHPQNQHGKSSYGVVQMPNGYAVIALHGVHDGVVKDKKQYDLFAEQVQNSEGLLEYELYKQSMMKTAKIVIEK
jgi:peptidyl-prolyl cis-trans isomerase D